MFPLPWNKAYRKKDGSISTIGAEIEAGGGGGGGGSVTPDYENNVLNCGTVGDYHYYVPMSKSYTGQAFDGYEIKTNENSSSSAAMIDIYSIRYAPGVGIVEKNFIKTLTHNGDKTYTDSVISVTYDTQYARWEVSSDNTNIKTISGEAVTFPVTWNYSTTVDYNWWIDTNV